ncbi:MAG TPA: pyridoxal phosphate-dependent aminotransferase [Chromatiales bacterium]|nr:pyridoxal phosphate-dependent aminotransferase [Chromatiales bacterium]HDO33959.1 pyridoxal phosphate-dependent aminotransferase [Chromatiales bacterium]
MPSLPVARRMAGIEPFQVMDLLARARSLEAQGRSIVHMEIGEPDFPTAGPIVEAGCRALRAGHTHYTPAAGLSALREAIAADYARRHGVAIDAQRILVTPGASGALQIILAALVDPGRRVLMADPGYPCNRHFVRLFDGVAVSVPVDASTGYQLTPERVERHWTPETVAVLLASPANPTGTVIGRAQLEGIRAVTERRGGALIADEIYHGLVYGGPASSAVGAAEDADVFIVNSFSKYFGMTGWRVGWLVSPPRWVRELDKLAQNLFLAASTPAQYAALAALEPATAAILDARRDEFRERRDYLLPALREIGFRIPVVPQGAFYLYADCAAFTTDSDAFARALLEEAGVAVTPGRDFGTNAPERHLRFAYTTALDRLEEGVERIRAFVARRDRPRRAP